MVLNNTVAVCLSKDPAKASVTETACINQLLPTANVNQVIAQTGTACEHLRKSGCGICRLWCCFNANGTVSSPSNNRSMF